MRCFYQIIKKDKNGYSALLFYCVDLNEKSKICFWKWVNCKMIACYF